MTIMTSDTNLWRQSLMMLLMMWLAGCSNDSWRDTTGQLRGQPEFKMDEAFCQQAGDAAQSDTQANAAGSCDDSKCQAVASLLSPVARPPAVDNCLVAHGWKKVAALPAPTLSEPNLSTASKEAFSPRPGVSRVFVFGVYSSFADKAFFGTTYRLIVGGRSIGTFSDKQFLEFDVPIGNYSLEVQEFGWLGTFLTSARTTLNIGSPEKVDFIAVPTSSSDIELEMVKADYGMAKVAERKRVATR